MGGDRGGKKGSHSDASSPSLQALTQPLFHVPFTVCGEDRIMNNFSYLGLKKIEVKVAALQLTGP